MITIPITIEILKFIAEIDEFKGGWRAYKYLTPERLEALRKVATVESIASSTRIEGSKLSDQEVEALLQNIEHKRFETRDEQEVAGYADVMHTIFESYASIPLTENYIKQLHAMLLKYSDKDVRHRGEYKTLSNNVVAFDGDGKELGIIFETTAPFDTSREMAALIHQVNTALDDNISHPLLIIAAFIVQFLAIHPFQDGNGRLSRILTTLLLLKQGYAYVPYSSMESIIEANKESYYLALRRTQKTLKTDNPKWDYWVVFFLHTMKKQKDKLLRKIEHEHYALNALPQLASNLIELTKEKGRISVSDAAMATGANRSTVKKHLADLVKNNQLIQHGQGRATWYSLPLPND